MLQLRNGSTWALAAALVGTLFIAAPAAADARAGALRIGTDIRALTFLHYPEDGQVRVQAGFLGTDLLLTRPQLVVSGAYMLTDDIVVGARVGLGYQEVTLFGSNAEVGAFGVIPFLEFLFADGDIRPFVGAEVGFQLTFVDIGTTFSSLETEGLAIAGGLGGVHFFIEEAFSISPALHFDFLYDGSTERAGYQILFLVSLEGWVGGH